MARMKVPSKISARDPNFTRRLEISLPEEMLDEPVSDAGAKVTSPADRHENTSPTISTEKPAPAPAPAPAPKAASKAASPKVQDKTKPVSKPPHPEPRAGEGVSIRLSFSIPEEFEQRAEKWAASARCNKSVIAKKAMGKIREGLLEHLARGLSFEDVPQDRAVKSPWRFSSSLLVSADVNARLLEELDPQGLVGLSPPLSRWVRKELSAKLDRLLTENGF